MAKQAGEFTLSDSHDVDRMNFMFGPFPADSRTNPKHWDSKISYWREEIRRSCLHFSDFSVSCEKLRCRFRLENGRTPHGLHVVIKELLSMGDLLPESYYGNVYDETWSEWSVGLVRASASWLWDKVQGDKPIAEQARFVLKDVLQKFSMEFLDKHYLSMKSDKTDHVVPWNVAKLYKVNNMVLNDDQLTLVLGFLRSVGKVKVAMLENGEKVIKFQLKSQSAVESVNAMDLDIVRLKKAIAKLTIESSQLEDEGLRLQARAQNLLRENNRSQAKKTLAQKQKVLKTCAMKQDALSAMKDNLRVIQEADTTKMITDALNSSASLLSRSYKERGLTVDHVENVIDKVTEANEMVAEVDEMLSAGLKRLDDGYDTDDLERELEELTLGSISVSGTPSSPILQLPDVPSESPSAVVSVKQERRRDAKSQLAVG